MTKLLNLGSWETILGPTKGVAVLAQQSVLLFNTWDHFKIDTEDIYFRLGFSHRFTSPILLYIVGKVTGIDDSIMFLEIGLLTKPGMLVLYFLHNLETMLE